MQFKVGDYVYPRTLEFGVELEYRPYRITGETITTWILDAPVQNWFKKRYVGSPAKFEEVFYRVSVKQYLQLCEN